MLGTNIYHIPTISGIQFKRPFEQNNLTLGKLKTNMGLYFR